MKKKSKKIKEIKGLLDRFSVQGNTTGDCKKNHVRFGVAGNQDITDHISALLQLCHCALEGGSTFLSPSLKNYPDVGDSVSRAIEIVLTLLPHGQMYLVDRIEEILTDKENKDEKQEKEQTA